MKLLILRAARSAMETLIEFYIKQDFDLTEEDNKDLEKMREYKAMLDGKIVKELNK